MHLTNSSAGHLMLKSQALFIANSYIVTLDGKGSVLSRELPKRSKQHARDSARSTKSPRAPRTHAIHGIQINEIIAPAKNS